MSNESSSSREDVALTDLLKSEGLSSVFDDVPETLRIEDEEGELQPVDLGYLLHLREDSEDTPEFFITSSVEWFPDAGETLEELFEGPAREALRDLLLEMSQYDEDDARESIRELMQACDEMMETLSDQPDVIETLDDKLWNWFQDAPSEETLDDDLTPILLDLLSFYFVEDESSDVGTESVPDDGSAEEIEEAQPESESSESKDDVEDQNTGEGSATADGDTFTMALDADPTMVEDFLKEANDHLQQLDNLLVQAEENPDETTLGELFRSMHTLKGGFGFCGLEHCTDITHAAEDLLDELKEDPPEEIPPIWMDLFFDTLDTVRLICGALEDAVENEDDSIQVETTREYLDTLEDDLRKACEGTTDQDAFESADLKNAGDTEGGDAAAEQELGEETVSIELDSIGEIVDLIGELVISHSALQEQLNGDLDRNIENSLNKQEKILDQLQRRSMNLRMLPVKKEFDKFPRIVRDLSRDLDKEINLHVEGADTEIDKSVLDALHGPLVHLVRNACDHGLETPEERRANGKDPEGTLYLRAYHESGNVYIEVEDDGAGLDRNGIESKAIDRGIIDEDHDLSDSEIDELIFHQGFSTTDEVSDVSGRGVGMDVVASEIEKLRGNIAIDSTPGEGTKLTIELPLTVAIIDGLIARLGDERMIFPVSQVVESINPSDDDLREVQGQGKVVQVRDDVIPYVEPAEFIDGVTEPDSFDGRTILVLVRSHSGQFAVRVDELVSHEQVVIKSLEGYSLEENELISGGAILGDGTVGLILDVPGMVRSYRQGTDDSELVTDR